MRSKISEYHVSNVIDEFELRALCVSSSLLEDAVRSVLVVFLASLAASLLSRLMRRIEQKMTSKRSDPDSVRRVATAYRTGLMFGRIVIWSVAGVTLLSIMGVSIAPLLTAAGVAGIAAGFAAQSLVKDYFSGFIILLEGQLRVDDSRDRWPYRRGRRNHAAKRSPARLRWQRDLRAMWEHYQCREHDHGIFQVGDRCRYRLSRKD